MPNQPVIYKMRDEPILVRAIYSNLSSPETPVLPFQGPADFHNPPEVALPHVHITVPTPDTSAPSSAKPVKSQAVNLDIIERKSTPPAINPEIVQRTNPPDTQSIAPADEPSFNPTFLNRMKTAARKRVKPKVMPNCCVKFYLPYRFWIWILLMAIFSYFIVCKKDFERTRGRLASSAITFNLNRAICVEETNVSMSTSNCLLRDQIQHLNQAFIRNACRSALVRIIRKKFCHSDKNQPNQTSIDNQIPVRIEGGVFNTYLTDQGTNTDNTLKYTTCLRVFEKNPFGDVKIFPSANDSKTDIIDRYDFMYRNYGLFKDCELISPDPILTTFFRDPVNLNFLLFSTFLFTSVCLCVSYAFIFVVYSNWGTYRSNTISPLTSGSCMELESPPEESANSP